MDPVVHFEMPYEDQGRLAAFYASAFGWKMQGTSEEMGNYVLAMTSKRDRKAVPKLPAPSTAGSSPRSPIGRRNIHPWSSA